MHAESKNNVFETMSTTKENSVVKGVAEQNKNIHLVDIKSTDNEEKLSTTVEKKQKEKGTQTKDTTSAKAKLLSTVERVQQVQQQQLIEDFAQKASQAFKEGLEEGIQEGLQSLKPEMREKCKKELPEDFSQKAAESFKTGLIKGLQREKKVYNKKSFQQKGLDKKNTLDIENIAKQLEQTKSELKKLQRENIKIKKYCIDAQRKLYNTKKALAYVHKQQDNIKQLQEKEIVYNNNTMNKITDKLEQIEKNSTTTTLEKSLVYNVFSALYLIFSNLIYGFVVLGATRALFPKTFKHAVQLFQLCYMHYIGSF